MDKGANADRFGVSSAGYDRIYRRGGGGDAERYSGVGGAGRGGVRSIHGTNTLGMKVDHFDTSLNQGRRSVPIAYHGINPEQSYLNLNRGSGTSREGEYYQPVAEGARGSYSNRKKAASDSTSETKQTDTKADTTGSKKLNKTKTCSSATSRPSAKAESQPKGAVEDKSGIPGLGASDEGLTTKMGQFSLSEKVSTNNVNSAQPKAEKLQEIWELSSQEKRVIQLAEGLKDVRLSNKNHKDEYKKYLKLAVDFISSVDCFATKKPKITLDDFETLVQLQRTFSGNKDEGMITQSEFSTEMFKLGSFSTDSKKSEEQSKKILALLGRLSNKDEIRSLYNNTLSNEMRKSVKNVLYRGTIDRFSKAIWEYEKKNKDEIVGVKSRVSQETSSDSKLCSNEYEMIGVKALDDKKISKAFFKVMEDFVVKKTSGSEESSKNSMRVNKKDPPSVFWTRKDFQNLSNDMRKISEHHLRKPRYNSVMNLFVDVKDRDSDIKSALRKYLRSGNKRLGDNEVCALIPCYMHNKKYVTEDDFDRLMHEIQTAHNRGGSVTNLRFEKLSFKEREKMRYRVVEKSVSSFFHGKAELKGQEKSKKSKEKTESKKELNDNIVDEEFYKKRVTSGSDRHQSSSESPEALNKAVAIYTKKRNPYDLRSKVVAYADQASKKKETFKVKLTAEVGLLPLDDRYLTLDFLKSVRFFVNAFADFQSKEVDEKKSKTLMGKIFGKKSVDGF